MRKDTSFSDRKLTDEEFAAKYWLDGDAPYQYHTTEPSDGRDEREQLLFNNSRALFELFDWLRQQRHVDAEATKRTTHKKTAAFCAVCAAVSIGTTIVGYLLK